MNRKSSDRFVFDSKTFVDNVCKWIQAIATVVKILPLALIIVMFLWFFIKTMMEAHIEIRSHSNQSQHSSP